MSRSKCVMMGDIEIFKAEDGNTYHVHFYTNQLNARLWWKSLPKHMKLFIRRCKSVSFEPTLIV